MSYPSTGTAPPIRPPAPTAPRPSAGKVETKSKEPLTEEKAAVKIQSAFRGMKARHEVIEKKAFTEVEGDILATVTKVSIWKICGDAKELVGQGEVHLVKTHANGKAVTYLWFNHENAQPSGVFPCPLEGHVPVMRHATNYLMFPTIEFSKGLFIGMVAHAKDEAYQKFVHMIEAVASLVDSEALQRAKANGQKIQMVARKTADMVKVAGATAADYISRGGGWLKQKVAPAKQPVKVSESTVQTVAAAKVGAEKAVQMSALAADVVSKMAASMAHAIVENVESQDSYQQLVARTHTPKPPSSTMESAKLYAGSAIVGYQMLVEAMMDSSTLLVAASSEAAADVVEKRYGEEVGSVAHDVAEIAISVSKTSKNVSKLGYMPVAKMVVKESGMEIARDVISPPPPVGEEKKDTVKLQITQ